MHFKDLKRKFKKPSSKYRTTSSPWILDTTCNLEYQRTTLVRKSRASQVERRVLTRKFQKSLKEYRRVRVRILEYEIKALLSNDQVREV